MKRLLLLSVLLLAGPLSPAQAQNAPSSPSPGRVEAAENLMRRMQSAQPQPTP